MCSSDLDRDAEPLQVRLELPSRDARDLRADAAEVLRLAAGGDLIADRETLAANLTGTCHGNDSLGRWSAAGPPDGNGASQDSHSAISRKNSRETPRSGEAQETSRRASS